MSVKDVEDYIKSAFNQWDLDNQVTVCLQSKESQTHDVASKTWKEIWLSIESGSWPGFRNWVPCYSAN